MKTNDNTIEVLSIGQKNGCFTIIAGFDAYQKERASEQIAKLEEEKRKFINGEKSSWSNFDSAETFDRLIEVKKDRKLYKIRCKCGREFFGSKEFFLSKKWRDCGDECNLKLQREAKRRAAYQRIESPTYNITFPNNIHDSLQIIECVNDKIEGEPFGEDRRKKVQEKYIYIKNFVVSAICVGKNIILGQMNLR